MASPGQSQGAQVTLSNKFTHCYEARKLTSRIVGNLT